MIYKEKKINAFKNYMETHSKVNNFDLFISDLDPLINDLFLPFRKSEKYDTKKATSFFIKREKLPECDD
jgi:hypothetical protein